MEFPPRSIFICYRRDDSADAAGRIYDRLVPQIGRDAMYRDVDAIPIGVDFREHVHECLRQCRIGLVIIGREWQSAASPDGTRRLDDPEDQVRIEIETMLSRAYLRVVPIYVGGARVPAKTSLPEALQPLVFLNGVHIRRDPDFDHDMDRLTRELSKAMEEATRGEAERAEAARLDQEEAVRAEAARLVQEEGRAETARLAREEERRAEAVRLAREEEERAEAARVAREEEVRLETARHAREEKERIETARLAQEEEKRADAARRVRVAEERARTEQCAQAGNPSAPGACLQPPSLPSERQKPTCASRALSSDRASIFGEIDSCLAQISQKKKIRRRQVLGAAVVMVSLLSAVWRRKADGPSVRPQAGEPTGGTPSNRGNHDGHIDRAKVRREIDAIKAEAAFYLKDPNSVAREGALNVVALRALKLRDELTDENDTPPEMVKELDVLLLELHRPAGK